MKQREARHLFLIARMKPGVSTSQAHAEMTVLSRRLAAAYPKEERGQSAVLTRATLLPPDLLSDAEVASGVLLGLTLLVLLIACANAANLLLVMAVGRRQESAIKLALGASRGRLVRDFLREGVAISAISALLGWCIASA